MITQSFTRWTALAVFLLAPIGRVTPAAEKTERFDREPAWEGQNNRANEPKPRHVKQDFGYSRTSHAGGVAGEIGGYVGAAAEPAYYALSIPESSFDEPLSASGTLACNDRPFHLLLGFFNRDTLKEWRTPNTIALRLNGRGAVFYAYSEYATSRWRAGGDDPISFPTIKNPETGRQQLKGSASKGQVHRWSLVYDPQGNGGQGAITATIDGEKSVCHLAPGHKLDRATFNRFGILPVMKSVDDGGELWLDDITVNGNHFDFADDPQWDGFQNRRTYETALVRPRFDFGYSPTQFAKGQGRGELGGTVFRGDCRYADKMAYYADRLNELTLERPIRARGKVTLRRGVSDSGVLIGFFDSHESIASNPAQDTGLPKGFFGISTDGPSREGFYFAPTYRIGGDARADSGKLQPPHIYPDGQAHDWTFEYLPAGAEGRGETVVTLDDKTVRLPLADGHKALGGRFDRFGIITTWIDGNSQGIFFDDLTYTFRQ